MTCSKCGTAVSTGAAFCPNCGTATGDTSAATVAIQVAQMEDPLLVHVREALAQFYVIEKELGRGGMAVVYRGKEKGLEREVAVKVLPPELALQGGTADRFRREARLAASLEHQNIIPVYRVGEEKGLIYMAMKFVRGRALDSIIEQQGALPVPVVVRILAAAASGLAHAHEHNVVHRDIKGANILIELDGRPLVADFGIARAMTENSMTASGMVIGTPNFMSPEQCGGSKVGPQSDQYSLGILGFQMLTGQLPFEADSIMGIIQHHYMTPPPDIRAVREGVPQELLDVILKALAKKPEGRYATTHEMAEALDAVPMTPQEKRDSLTMLKQLSQGEGVSKVRTETLPPLSVTASISGQRASTPSPISSGEATKPIPKQGAQRPGPRVQPKAGGGSKVGIMVAGVLVLAAAGGGGYWKFVMNKPQQQQPAATNPAVAAPPPTVVETLRVAAPPPSSSPGTPTRQSTRQPRQQQPVQQNTPAPQNPAPAPQPAGNGRVLISAGACDAEIFVDGNRIGSRRASAQVTAGTAHAIRVVPETGAAWTSSVTVANGETRNVVAQGITCGNE
jgi:serine/threonine protein kinase